MAISCFKQIDTAKPNSIHHTLMHSRYSGKTLARLQPINQDQVNNNAIDRTERMYRYIGCATAGAISLFSIGTLALLINQGSIP